MIYNNLVSLVLHAAVGIVIYSLFVGVNALFRTENALVHSIFILISCVGVCLYVFMAYKFLRKTTGRLQNLFSVLSVSLIGFGVWIYCSLDPIGGLIWILYGVYNMAFFPAMVVFVDGTPTYTIWFSLIPSLCLWLGLNRKVKSHNVLVKT